MNQKTDDAAAGLHDLLGADAPRRWWRRKTPWIALALLLAALAAVLALAALVLDPLIGW